MDKLYIIDGHALIFRMYYAFARHPMINSKGADMSILFGFTKYLMELIDKRKPDGLAVAFDPPGGTFRNELYPAYKANRTETPQLVIDALEPLKELCGALNIPVLMVPGFEADDVILCSVARLEDDKRPLELLELFRRVQDRKKFRLLIVGKGQLRAQMDEKIREYSLEDKVKILDRVLYDSMWKIYTASDYYVNMSEVEIFGMAIMEAVYYHCSVAARRAIGPSLTLKDMRGHCLCDTDADIEAWLTSDYPSEEALTESADRVVEDFSWKPCARAFIGQIEAQRTR